MTEAERAVIDAAKEWVSGRFAEDGCGAKLIAALDRLHEEEPESPWIACSERLPEPEQWVLVYSKEKTTVACLDEDEGVWRYWSGDFAMTTYTYWMNLPEGPK